MPKALDRIGHRSRKGCPAKNTLPYADIALPSISRLNSLHLEMTMQLSSTGNADDMRLYYANPLWHECMQYNPEETAAMGRDIFRILVGEADQFRFSKMVRELSKAENGFVKKETFVLIGKNKEETLALWDFTVILWNFPGKPDLISFCGAILDENLHYGTQIQEYLNRMAHSEKVKKARALPKDLYDVLELMYHCYSNAAIAKNLNKSVSCIKGRKNKIMNTLEFACYKDLLDFVFQSSLFY